MTRKETIVLVARQIAIFEGYTWQVAPNAQQSKKQSGYITLATNIAATIERGLIDYRWADQ